LASSLVSCCDRDVLLGGVGFLLATLIFVGAQVAAMLVK
jgi:hypothetical protein